MDQSEAHKTFSPQSSGEDSDSSFMSYVQGSHVFDLIKIALLAYFLYVIITSFLNKGTVKPRFQGNTRERLYKRFVYSNFDVIRDLDNEESELMKQTFENTVINASTLKIKPTPGSKSNSRRVSFHADVKQA